MSGRAVLSIDGGLHQGPVRLWSAGFDGGFWVTLPNVPGAPLYVHGRYLSDVRDAPVPANPHGLTAAGVRLLQEFDRAEAGLADFEHTAAQSTVAEVRRSLSSTGLVARIDGIRRFRGAKHGMVWAITVAGRHALHPPAPTVVEQALDLVSA